MPCLTLLFGLRPLYLSLLNLHYFGSPSGTDQKKGRKVKFYAHNDTVEVVWTILPAVAMTYLVVSGLEAWNTTMADVDPERRIY